MQSYPTLHTNRYISEAPKDPYFVQTRDDVPFKAEFKPAVKVLSRKPTPAVVSGTGSPGLDKLNIEDDEDDDEDELVKKPMSMEERRLKAQHDREEKQRKYEEARQRLFGTADTMNSMDTSTDNTVPPARSTGESRTRGKTRGGRESRQTFAQGNKTRQLYDSNYTAKPESVSIQKKEEEAQSVGSDSFVPNEIQPIRAPRGPDGSGRGGFGFATRGRGLDNHGTW